MNFMELYKERGLKETYKEYTEKISNFVSNNYAFLCFVYNKREELWEEFEKNKEHKNIVAEDEDFIGRTDKWLRRRENKSLKDYDASCYHLSDLLVPPSEKKEMDAIISKMHMGYDSKKNIK